MDRMPSWFTGGHRKDFLLRHACSLQRAGQLPADYLQHLLTMQDKAIQTPSAMDLGPLYGQPLDGFHFTTDTADADFDYDRPVSRRHSDGTAFPRPLIEDAAGRRSNQAVMMQIPEHIRKAPGKYLPGKLAQSETSETEPDHRSTATPIRSSGSSRKTPRYSYRYLYR